MYMFQWLIVIQKPHKVFLLSLLYDRRPRIQILISTRKWRIRIRGRSKPFLHYGISQIESILYYKTCTVRKSAGYSKFRIISSPHQRIIHVCLKRKYKWAVQYCFSALIYNIDIAKYRTVLYKAQIVNYLHTVKHSYTVRYRYTSRSLQLFHNALAANV